MAPAGNIGIGFVSLRPPEGHNPFVWDNITLDMLDDKCICKQRQSRKSTQTCHPCRVDRMFQNLQPRQAVEAASIPRAPPFAINKLAALALADRRYRRAGAADAFIQRIEASVHSGDFHWVIPTVGLINILSAIYREETLDEDNAILRTIHSSYEKVRDFIWADVDRLLGISSFLDGVRMIIAKYLSMLLIDPVMKMTMYDDRTLTLILRCWVHFKSCKMSMRSAVCETLTLALASYGVYGASPADHLNKVVEVAHIPSLIAKINTVLTDKSLIDIEIFREMESIGHFLLLPKTPGAQPFVPVFLHEGVHRLMIDAGFRQLMDGSDMDSKKDTLYCLSTFIEGILDACPGKVVDILTDFVTNTPIMDVAAFSFRLMTIHPAIKSPGISGFLFIFLYRMAHSLCSSKCQYNEVCEIHLTRTPAFQIAIKNSITRVAIPTLVFLQQHRDQLTNGPVSLQIWCDLLALAGISDWDVREQHRDDKKCCNRICSVRLAFKEAEKTKKCVRCEAVYYCGKDCQRSDWSIHKLECQPRTSIDTNDQVQLARPSSAKQWIPPPRRVKGPLSHVIFKQMIAIFQVP